MRINTNKTKYTTITGGNIGGEFKIEKEELKKMGECFYLSERIAKHKLNQTAELIKIVKLGMSAFGKLNYIFNRKFGIHFNMTLTHKF